MQVKLVRHTPEPEKTVAMSARLCYSPIGAAQLEEKISDEQAAALVRKLVSMGHFSTLEHVTFTFAIEGVSRVLTHQLVRHRIASYSQQSQRYVKEHNFEVIMPPSIAAKPEAKAEFEDLMQKLQDAYNKFTEIAELFQPALLYACAVGNPRAGGKDAGRMQTRCAGYF